MTTAETANPADTPDTDRRDAIADQIFHAVIGAQDVMHIYLGHQLGLYAALALADSASPAELAEQAGIAERYAREWLEQQAVAGLLDVATETGDARTRRYRMPPGVADVLCRPDSLYFLAPLSSLVIGIAKAMPEVVSAFRSGGGVPYEAYGDDLRTGIADANRPMYAQQLVEQWIPALPDIEARLRTAQPPAAIADLGCGTGRSTISLAQGFPSAQVLGIDADAASIEDARRNAADAGVGDRVTFSSADARSFRPDGRYDLVTMFETLHDMAYPVEVLRTARSMLAPGGVVVGDERVGETFTAPGDDLDRFNYGWSAVHCLAVALTEPGAAGTGTVIRPETVRRYATEAGFSNVTVLPIEHDFWRFYRLDL